MEKIDEDAGKKYTWCESMTLGELLDHREEILSNSQEVVYGIDSCPRIRKTLCNCYNATAIKDSVCLLNEIGSNEV